MNGTKYNILCVPKTCWTTSITRHDTKYLSEMPATKNLLRSVRASPFREDGQKVLLAAKNMGGETSERRPPRISTSAHGGLWRALRERARRRRPSDGFCRCRRATVQRRQVLHPALR